jgi:Protein of unknown function (DUF2975)
MAKTGQVKMKMLAKILNVICNILFWVAAVGFCIFLLGNIVLVFVPAKSIVLNASTSGSLSATLGGTMFFKFNPQVSGNLLIKPFLQAFFAWIAVEALMMSVILFEVKRILKSVVQDNPFEKGNSKNLTIIAISLIVGACIMPLLEGRIFSAIIRVLQISNINFSYSIDCTLLFTGIIILILAGVFQYGNYLQEEVDSTL